MTQSLTYVEIDVAAWSPTSPDSPQTELTFRFAIDTDYLPTTIPCIPSVKEVKFSPAIVSLGTDLGQRASITVSFRDHKHQFANEGFNSGTFWGKFRARYGLKLRGHPMRIIRGIIGQALTEMEIRNYIIEEVDGPAGDGTYQIIAKDVLKYTDGDRSQAPVLSNGSLVANITNVATSATLTPTGIGNLEYPASGVVAIGGSEICTFTRAGDVLTLTRAQFNTVGVAHNSGDRVQLCLSYSGVDCANIIDDLLITYADVPSSYIPLGDWSAETTANLGVVYTALIAEPTSVDDLVSELVEQAALALWWDDINQKIRLQVLKPVATTSATYTMDQMIMGSLRVNEQPEKRISQCYVYYGKINPLTKEDQIDNYRSTVLARDTQAEVDYGTPSIKKIFSRWIPAGGRTTAQTIANKQLGRYRDPPRRFDFDLLRYSLIDPMLGSGYQLNSWQLQDTSGNQVNVPIQVTRLEPGPDLWRIEAEEMLWTPYGTDVAPGIRSIIFDANENSINLRTRHDELYPAPVSGNTINATILSGVTIGSTSRTIPALDIGSWPVGVIVTLTVLGRIEGCGGTGGAGGAASLIVAAGGAAGSKGGTALLVARAITLTDASGQIWGGGGGGGGGGSWSNFTDTAYGGGGGGGGAGTLGGSRGNGGFGTTQSGGNGVVGTATLGGNPGTTFPPAGAGGGGGTPGNAGVAGTNATGGGAGGSGGAAGNSIDGIANVTTSGGAGDRRGPQI